MPSSNLVEVEIEIGVEVVVGVEVEVVVQMLLKLELKQLYWQVHYFLRGCWVGGWCGRIENKAISAFKLKLKLKLSLTKSSLEDTFKVGVEDRCIQYLIPSEFKLFLRVGGWVVGGWV